MGFRIRHLSTRFALLLATAAVFPLLAYGLVSIVSLQRGTRETVIAGNLNVATRAAEEIGRYVSTNAELLKALAADLQDTGLERWQQDRILKNYILQFREFREITLFDEARAPLASSRVGPARVRIPANAPVALAGVSMTPLHVDDDMLPTATFAIHLRHFNQPAGWLVGEFSLEQMWRMVDRIRIGAHGFAMVIDPAGQLVAHGSPDKKALVAQEQLVVDNPLVSAARAVPDGTPVSQEYADEAGERELGVAARIPQLGWTVIVEQPTAEAYATATQLRRQLLVAIALAVVAMVSLGVAFGRSFLRPIHALRRGTQALAAGHLDAHVAIRGADEFAQLGTAFNQMADRLVELQEDVKRQERQATFGRIAAGLVHDLAHPIQNIGNSARLLAREAVDAESREMFRRTIDRELANLRRFLDDLRNLVRPKPMERFAVDVNTSVAEIVEAMRVECERHGVSVGTAYAADSVVINSDRFALERVYRNLITNAIQATAAGGRIVVTTARTGDRAEIRVADTGTGIAPERLAHIFDDFVTTKRRGLGLGLAISKRIVEQLDGTIDVESEIGRGTTFTLRFPARDDLAARAAAS